MSTQTIQLGEAFIKLVVNDNNVKPGLAAAGKSVESFGAQVLSLAKAGSIGAHSTGSGYGRPVFVDR